MKNIPKGEWKLFATPADDFSSYEIISDNNLIGCTYQELHETTNFEIAQLICDAGNTYNATNLTPSELLEQRNELLQVAKSARFILKNYNEGTIGNKVFNEITSLISKIENK